VSALIAQVQGTPAIRLFCFPYAGAGATAYHGWAAQLPRGVQVCSVQLPGRASQERAPLQTTALGLVKYLIPALRQQLDLPFAFFGHSMGALIAFEMARELRRAGLPGPQMCFVSGRVPPHRPSTTGLCNLSDEELIKAMRRLGGTPEAVLRDPPLMKLLLPIVRADAEITERYAHTEEAKLQMPIVALGGQDDPGVSAVQLEEWRNHTTGDFKRYEFPGAHFFINTAREAVLRLLGEHLLTEFPSLSGR
jgi:medium-chain acyl-[acyl-carrier-protein] hydrolase